MRSRAIASRRGADSGAARRSGRRPRGVVGEATTPRRTRRSGDHRRLRAGERQAGRARLLSDGGASGQDRGGARGGPAARLRLRPGLLPTYIGNGPSRIGWWISRTPSALLGPVRSGCSSTGGCCSTQDGQKALYALPMGSTQPHPRLEEPLEQAGFTLEDIPKRVGAFWSFWCDQVQPAVRQATGRDDIWGVGLPMSVEAADTWDPVLPVRGCLRGGLRDPDGRLVIDDPEIRQRLIKAIDSYTAIYRKGCTPPDSVTLATIDNNEQFLAQTVVMTPNDALDPQRAQARASRGLLQEHGDDRMAARPGRRPFRSAATFTGCGLQGRRQRRDRQGVRPLPRGPRAG